jgi:hypothetical protein
MTLTGTSAFALVSGTAGSFGENDPPTKMLAAFMIVPPELRPREVLGVVMPRSIHEEPGRIASHPLRSFIAIQRTAGADPKWPYSFAGTTRSVSSSLRACHAQDEHDAGIGSITTAFRFLDGRC